MIRVRPNGEFKFAPGQYATLGVEGPDKRAERPYSIVSSPHESELEFFFELVPPGDLISGHRRNLDSDVGVRPVL